MVQASPLIGKNEVDEKMIEFLKKFFDEKFWKFIFVGVINTIVGMAINYGLLFLGDMFHWYDGIAAAVGVKSGDINYWVSSVTNYTLTSILSFVLNKNITFKSRGNTGKSIIKFVLNIAVCYLLAYGIAQPLTDWIMRTWFAGVGEEVIKYISTFVGMVLFTGFNYIGQRFFAFNNKDKSVDGMADE